MCHQAKTKRVRLPGLLAPLPVPDQAWSVMSLDFVEGLPMSYRFNAIIVVIDKFINMGISFPLHTLSLLCKLHNCIWIMYTSCMDCLKSLFQIETRSSLALCGKVYSR